MSQSKEDLERRERLHKWFKSDPEIWQDIVQELNISKHNEEIKLKARNCENRDWSSGWVCSHDFMLDMERYFKKQCYKNIPWA